MSYWEAKDLKSKAPQGKAFPLPYSSVVHNCKTLDILHASGQRIQVAMRNQKPSKETPNNSLLAELRPREEIAIYSLAEDFNSKLAASLTLAAIETFAILNKTPLKKINNSIQTFQAHIGEDSELRLCHMFLHYRQPKYRGDQKFSHAFNTQIIKTESRFFRVSNGKIEYINH